MPEAADLVTIIRRGLSFSDLLVGLSEKYGGIHDFV